MCAECSPKRRFTVRFTPTRGGVPLRIARKGMTFSCIEQNKRRSRNDVRERPHGDTMIGDELGVRHLFDLQDERMTIDVNRLELWDGIRPLDFCRQNFLRDVVAMRFQCLG